MCYNLMNTFRSSTSTGRKKLLKRGKEHAGEEEN
jgi:hypothetical protein